MNRPDISFVSLHNIYQDNLSTVFRIAYTFLGNKRAAMAVTRYTFQSMIQEGVTFQNKAQERDWLARKSTEASLATIQAGVSVSPDGLADETVSAFIALPHELKAAAYLFYAEGCTVKKIADILGESQETVAAKLDSVRSLLISSQGGDLNA